MEKKEEDLVINKNSFSIILKAGWLEYLKDFGVTRKDFEILGEQVTRKALDCVIEIIKKKNSTP